MEPSGGSSPLPASPLPPSPFQQTYSPETGITFTPAAVNAPTASPSLRRKGPPKAVGAIFIVVFVVVILAAAGVFDGMFGSSGSSSSPTVKVTNTSASHVCPISGAPTETFRFTLVNSGSANANAQIGFYLNDAEVHSGTFSAPSGASTPYTETVILGSCPPSGSTYYLDLVSVTAA